MREHRGMAFIRIDPALPVVWRTPNAIQIGVESPRVVLEPVTARDERMLAAARAGLPSEALAAVGGCAEGEAAAFLDRIRPVLLGAGTAPEPAAALVRVHSAAREEIVRTGRMLGLVGAVPGARPRVGVIVADHAVPLRAYRDWMRDDVPHFAVVFGVRTITVGPVVRPGVTGCLRCADLRRLSVDPVWPVVAAQLIGMRAASAFDAVARTEALCAATRLAIAVAKGSAAVAGAEPIEPHADCGCTLDLHVPMLRVG